jgi:hypothetical protein
LAITAIQILDASCFEAALKCMDEKDKGLVAQAALENPNLKFAPDAALFLLSQGFLIDSPEFRKGPFQNRRLCRPKSLERLEILRKDERLTELLRRNFPRNFLPQEEGIHPLPLEELSSLSQDELLVRFDTVEKCEYFVRSMIQTRESSVLSRIVDALISIEDEGKREGALRLWGGIPHFFSLEYVIDSRRNAKVAERLWAKAFGLATQGRFRFLQVLLEMNHTLTKRCLAREIFQIIFKKINPTLLPRLVSYLDSDSAYLTIQHCYNEELFWENCSKDVVQKLSEDRKKDIADFLVENSGNVEMFRWALSRGILFGSMRPKNIENVKKWAMRKLSKDLRCIPDAIKGFEWLLAWLPPESPSCFLNDFTSCYWEAYQNCEYSYYYADIALIFAIKKWKFAIWIKFPEKFHLKTSPEKLRKALSTAREEKDTGLVDLLCFSFGANLTQKEIDGIY